MMKKGSFELVCSILFGAALFSIPSSADAFGFHGMYAGGASEYCDECNSGHVGFGGPGLLGGGLPGLPGGGLMDSEYGRRAVPASAYFANNYPEYLYGAPDIYAGFDEYDGEVDFVSPVISKTPFHYNYYNDQYNYSPYYGKHWEKNWYITQHVGYRSDSPAGAGVPSASGSINYGDASLGSVSLTNGQIENAGTAYGVSTSLTDGISVNSAAASGGNAGNYKACDCEEGYHGRFIYNFESFCDDDPPCYLLRPIANLFRAACGCCVPDSAFNGSNDCLSGGCCRAYSGHGGYGGFNCAGYRSGGCGTIADPFADDFGGYAVGSDFGGGIYVDAMGYDGGVFVDGNGCTSCSGETWTDLGEEQVVSESSAQTSSGDSGSETISTDEKSENSKADEKAEVKADENGNDSAAQTEEPASSETKPAAETPVAPVPETQPGPAADEDDAFQGIFDPVSTQNQPGSTPTSGSIRMKVPENAVVIINGYRTKLTGDNRTFMANDLIPGQVYTFEIRVLVEKDGQILSGVKETELRAGSTAEVAFKSRDLEVEKELTYAFK